MTWKRRENINLVSLICLSFLVISFFKQLLIMNLLVSRNAGLSAFSMIKHLHTISCGVKIAKPSQPLFL